MKHFIFLQIHKSITTLQGEDIVFLATDINLPGIHFILFLFSYLTQKAHMKEKTIVSSFSHTFAKLALT